MKRLSPTKLRELQKKWYARLKRAGFQDIENSRGELVDHRSVLDFSQRIGFRAGFWENIRDYYIWAEHMVTLGQFESRMDKKIWALHAQGRSSWEIGEHVSFDHKWILRKIKKIRSYLRLQWDEEDEAA